MKLKKLVVQGFKSFRDKTTIFFDEGITGIVGPNGCGKSNIVDALFWIMGEQSAKHLRGNSMKDVIFSGSSKYAPANFAECSLFIENHTGKHIHIGNKLVAPSEIQLTRKLYRNGETEYKINGAQCRLRDIQEVFMDTGAGAKSYSIIAQGEINRLVQSKPEERRVMIEEVAGITKFKMRRRESLKKIQATEQNLSRLNDLKTEIERNLGSLKKQAEKAQKARSLKDKIKRDEIIVDGHKVYGLLKNYRGFNTEVNEATINLESWKTTKNSLEIDLEEERSQKEIKIKKIDVAQAEYNEVSKELAQMEERLSNLCESLSSKEKLIDDKKNELQEIVEEKIEREKRKSELEAKREELLSTKNEDLNFDELEKELIVLKEELNKKRIKKDELFRSLQQKNSLLSSHTNEQYKLSNHLEELSSNLEDITKEMESLEEQYSTIGKGLSEERKEVSDKEEEYQKLKTDLERINSELQEKRNAKNNAEIIFKNREKYQIQLETRVQSLKKIGESLEGIGGATSAFLKSKDSEGFNVFGHDVKCDQKYEKAVSSIIGLFGESLLGSDILSAQKWQKENPKKQISISASSGNDGFLTAEEVERLNVNGVENLVAVSDVIDACSKVKEILQGIYITESTNETDLINLSKEILIPGLISLDGKTGRFNLFGATRFVFGADVSAGNSSVELNNQVESLKKELVLASDEMLNAETAFELSKSDFSQIERNREELLEKTQSSKEEFITLKTKLESKLNSFESNKSRIDILKNRKEQTSTKRFECTENEEKINHQIKHVESELSQIKIENEEILKSLEKHERTYDEKREFLNSKLVERKTFSTQLDSFEEQIKDILVQLSRLEAKDIQINEWVKVTQTEIIDAEKEISELEKNNLLRSQTLEDKVDQLSHVRDDLEKLITQMSDREEEVKILNQKINSTEKKLVEKDIKIKQIITDEELLTRNIFEKYHVDLRESVSNFLEMSIEDQKGLMDLSSMYLMESEEGQKSIEKVEHGFNRRFGNDLKEVSQRLRSQRNSLSAIGEINWQAIEDYDRQKLRFDFLVDQELELKSSLEDLGEAIDKIDQKSKERFKLAFDEVNAKFVQVFPIIFGGGEARLELKGTMEDPDAGVDIIAKPPGKKMQNINLMSGGEKAMTAVSLIFSIFLVKPSPFCLLDEVDAPLDDANIGRFSELLREMSKDSQFILITHNKKTMELNDTLYGVTMQEPGVSKALSVQLQ